MANEKTQTKKKRGRPPKDKKNGPVPKKQARKASEKTAERKAALKPTERADIKRKLVKHFGKTKIERALSNCGFKYEQDTVLLQWKKKLEQEIEDQEREVADYYSEIDAEYKRVGRPKSVFNWREFEYLCSIRCTLEEIAGFFQKSKTYIQDIVKDEYGETFSERYEKLSQGMNIAIRRKQLQVALDGDTKMLTFLGKNVLGQKEKVEFEGEVKVNSWVDLVNNLEPEKKKEETEIKGTE